MFNLIKKTTTLWLLFALTVALTISFVLISNHWGMAFLDGISSPEDAKTLLRSLTPEQIQVHIWTTAVVDVLYPLAYGSFFAGVALSFYRHFGLFLAIPSFLVIPVDIAEGVVQIYALQGSEDWLDYKAFLTPAKFALFYLGFAIAAFAWGRWLFLKVGDRLRGQG